MEKIYEALLAVQKELPEIKFNAEVAYNRVQFKYADLGEITRVVKPILNKHGIVLVHDMDPPRTICTTLLFKDETISSSFEIPDVRDPQNFGKWVTYTKRYQLASLLGIVAEEDDDGQVVRELTKEQAIERAKNEKSMKGLTEIYNEATKLGLVDEELRDILNNRFKELKNEK